MQPRRSQDEERLLVCVYVCVHLCVCSTSIGHNNVFLVPGRGLCKDV